MAQKETLAKQAVDKTTNGLAKATLSPAITLEGQGQRLWDHVLFGTGTCVGMIQGYANLGLPGDPCNQIEDLIGQLSAVLNQLRKNQ
jgi:hypothetical protein